MRKCHVVYQFLGSHVIYISAIMFTFWASMQNSGHKCLLPDRPEFGLNIKFDPIHVIYCFIGF